MRVVSYFHMRDPVHTIFARDKCTLHAVYTFTSYLVGSFVGIHFLHPMMEFQFYYFGGTKMDQTAGVAGVEDKGRVEEKDEAEANVVRTPGKPTMNFHARFMSKHC